MIAREIMSAPVITVGPETPIKDVAGLLMEKRISTVPVVEEDGRLVGIVSLNDLLGLHVEPETRRYLLPPFKPLESPETAGDAMTLHVVTAPPEEDVSDIAERMLGHHVNTIPIVENGRVVGIVTRRDLLEVLVRSDAAIQGEVNELLDDEVLMLGQYRAEVRDGVVTLSGPEDKASRRLAELLARSVPGVVDVQFG
ncbi:MAG TPA: CBS domain-containing protein [Actinomycetota bacterium]|nr:CBS domain-containing protein [Actinomycetota bacterium]